MKKKVIVKWPSKEEFQRKLSHNIKFFLMMLPPAKKDGSKWTQDEMIETIVESVADEIYTVSPTK